MDSNWIGYTESGKASYYAMKFQSKKTANGELYDKAKKTAAHIKLPFGTKIKVTNTKNNKSVINAIIQDMSPISILTLKWVAKALGPPLFCV
jgi:rare lipoprotein A